MKKTILAALLIAATSSTAGTMPFLEVLSIDTNALHPSVALRIHNETDEVISYGANQEGLPAVTIEYVTYPGPSKGLVYEEYDNLKWSWRQTEELLPGEHVDFVVEMEPFFRYVRVAASLYTSRPSRDIELKTAPILLKPMDQAYRTTYSLLKKPINKTISGKYQERELIKLIEDYLPRQVSLVQSYMSDDVMLRQTTFNDFKLENLYDFIHHHFGGEFSCHSRSKYYIDGNQLILIGELPQPQQEKSQQEPPDVPAGAAGR